MPFFSKNNGQARCNFSERNPPVWVQNICTSDKLSKEKGYRELVGSTLNSTYSKDNQEPIRVSFSSCKSCSIIIKVIYVVADPVHGLLDRNVPYVTLRYSYLWQEQRRYSY